jgi:hypothetical protein
MAKPVPGVAAGRRVGLVLLGALAAGLAHCPRGPLAPHGPARPLAPAESLLAPSPSCARSSSSPTPRRECDGLQPPPASGGADKDRTQHGGRSDGAVEWYSGNGRAKRACVSAIRCSGGRTMRQVMEAQRSEGLGWRAEEESRTPLYQSVAVVSKCQAKGQARPGAPALCEWAS